MAMCRTYIKVNNVGCASFFSQCVFHADHVTGNKIQIELNSTNANCSAPADWSTVLPLAAVVARAARHVDGRVRRAARSPVLAGRRREGWRPVDALRAVWTARLRRRVGLRVGRRRRRRLRRLAAVCRRRQGGWVLKGEATIPGA